VTAIGFSAVGTGTSRVRLGSVRSTYQWGVYLVLSSRLRGALDHTPVRTHLKLRYELFHSSFLLPHVILEYFDLSLEPHIFLSVGIELDLELYGILIKLLLLFDVVAVRRFHLYFRNRVRLSWLGAPEDRNQVLGRGLLRV
jgi:hypothetical protein